MNGAKSLSLIAPDQLTEARNISFASGAITKDGGATVFGGTLGAAIIGLYDFWPTTLLQRFVVVLADGTATKLDSAGAVSASLTDVVGVRGWTANDVPVFVEAGKEATALNKKLFIFTGREGVYYLDGDGVELTPLGTNGPGDWTGTNQPVCGANHEGRLWGAGNANSPHRVYWSQVNDHTDFVTTSGPIGSGTINLYPGEGHRIVAMISYKGRLVVLKYPRGLYVIDTAEKTSTALWTAHRISSTVGGAGPRCWCIVDDTIVFMDSQGAFYMLGATSATGDFTLQNFSARVYFDHWAKDNLALSRYPYVRAHYYGARREAHFALSAAGATTADRRIVWDFNKENPRLRYNDFPGATTEMAVYQDADGINRLMAGTSGGQMLKLDAEARRDDAAGIAATLATGALDLSGLDAEVSANARKNGRFLEMTVNPKGAWDVTLTLSWDGVPIAPISYSMAGAGATLGSFVLDTDKLGGQELVTVRHRITGSGKRFTLSVTNSGVDQDFSINKFFMDYHVASRNTQP